jgi:hypothetical protein
MRPTPQAVLGASPPAVRSSSLVTFSMISRAIPTAAAPIEAVGAGFDRVQRRPATRHTIRRSHRSFDHHPLPAPAHASRAHTPPRLGRHGPPMRRHPGVVARAAPRVGVGYWLLASSPSSWTGGAPTATGRRPGQTCSATSITATPTTSRPSRRPQWVIATSVNQGTPRRRSTATE